MEHANKGDLLEYINSRQSKCPGIGEDKSKKFFKQLVQGLSHCHQRNIVHRQVHNFLSINFLYDSCFIMAWRKK